MPTTNGYWEVDKQYAPRTEYWDTITTLTGIPTIHFEDYPELSGFECPDASHLDVTDTVQFTESFTKLVKGVLE